MNNVSFGKVYVAPQMLEKPGKIKAKSYTLVDYGDDLDKKAKAKNKPVTDFFITEFATMFRVGNQGLLDDPHYRIDAVQNNKIVSSQVMYEKDFLNTKDSKILDTNV